MYMCMQLYFHTVYNIIYIYIHIDIINPINISIEQKDAFFLGNQPLRCGKPMVIFISCSSFTKRKTCLHYIPSLPKSSNPSWGGVWTVKGLLRRCFWGPNAYLQGIWKTWVHYSSSLFAVVFGVVYSLAGYFKKDSYFSDSKVFFFSLIDVDLLERTMMIIFVLNSRTLTSSMLKASNQQPKLISMTMLLWDNGNNQPTTKF